MNHFGKTDIEIQIERFLNKLDEFQNLEGFKESMFFGFFETIRIDAKNLFPTIFERLRDPINYVGTSYNRQYIPRAHNMPHVKEMSRGEFLTGVCYERINSSPLGGYFEIRNNEVGLQEIIISPIMMFTLLGRIQKHKDLLLRIKDMDKCNPEAIKETLTRTFAFHISDLIKLYETLSLYDGNVSSVSRFLQLRVSLLHEIGAVYTILEDVLSAISEPITNISPEKELAQQQSIEHFTNYLDDNNIFRDVDKNVFIRGLSGDLFI